MSLFAGNRIVELVRGILFVVYSVRAAKVLCYIIAEVSYMLVGRRRLKSFYRVSKSRNGSLSRGTLEVYSTCIYAQVVPHPPVQALVVCRLRLVDARTSL
jgi:hypothetical protein